MARTTETTRVRMRATLSRASDVGQSLPGGVRIPPWRDPLQRPRWPEGLLEARLSRELEGVRLPPHVVERAAAALGLAVLAVRRQAGSADPQQRVGVRRTGLRRRLRPEACVLRVADLRLDAAVAPEAPRQRAVRVLGRVHDVVLAESLRNGV